LREDNADLRLTESGRRLGVVDDERWERFARKRAAITHEHGRLAATRLAANELPARQRAALFGPDEIPESATLATLLKRPSLHYQELIEASGLPPADPDVAAQVEVQIKYSGYIERQREQVERSARYEHWRLPADLDYGEVGGLSNEVRQKLARQRPETVGQAARISGVTPAAISLLLVHLKRMSLRAEKAG
jgi:tRNA uridine 5-carboxymethylaminomethyl modification enzyme